MDVSWRVWSRNTFQMRLTMLSAATRRKMSGELQSLPCPLLPIGTMQVRIGSFGKTGERRLSTTGRSPLGGSSVVRECLTRSVKTSEVSIDRTGPTRGASFLILFHRGACRRESAGVRRIRRCHRLRLSLQSFVLDRLWVPG